MDLIKMKKPSKKERLVLRIVLIILVFVFIILNYPYLDTATKKIFTDYETGIVDRVIDGDTVKIGNESVRLLGINSPEKGEKYSIESTKFLEEKVLNKTVEIRFGKDKYDRYKRKLGYLFLEGKNINLEIVEKGYANFYFPSGKDNYYPRFYSVWELCIKEEINLCEPSKDKCAQCIELSNWNVDEQIVELKNSCSFDCNLKNWTIKDEGRKKFTFKNQIIGPNKKIIVSKNDFEESYVWTKTGDTIYIRDNKDLLVLWKSY